MAAPGIDQVEVCRCVLETAMNRLIEHIGIVQIGNAKQFPFGWRKAAKGRTVWRLLEELISQNLEAKFQELGFHTFEPSDSEVGVYDFSFTLPNDQVRVYVNVKSAVKGGKGSKDDISKARALEEFFSPDPNRILLIATVEIAFAEDMSLKLGPCSVVPITWLPDIYVNPSNNGNLQSSQYKNLKLAVRRSGTEFLALLRDEIERAIGKRRAKDG
jgi:hypothetical protein